MASSKAGRLAGRPMRFNRSRVKSERSRSAGQSAFANWAAIRADGRRLPRINIDMVEGATPAVAASSAFVEFPRYWFNQMRNSSAGVPVEFFFGVRVTVALGRAMEAAGLKRDTLCSPEEHVNGDANT